MNDKKNDVRIANTNGAGVLSGGDDRDNGREFFQADVNTAAGATPPRVRKSESDQTEGHHVTGGGAVAEPYKHDVIGLGKNLAKTAAHATRADTAAPTPESKQRAGYVKGEYARNDEKVHGDSSRVPFKEMLKKSK
jgi:hypothetical protein